MKWNVKQSLFLLFSIPLYIYLAYFVERSDAFQLIVAYLSLFLIYFIYLNLKVFSKSQDTKFSLRHILLLGVVLRLLFLASVPLLSDDVYRFIWDGFMVVDGQNPYLILPQDNIRSGSNNDVPILQVLFSEMNSPGYYTVYPPVLQFIFSFCAYLSAGSPDLAIILLRLVVIMAEMGIIVLIYKILEERKLDTNAALIYVINPLVIVELSGNLHMEAIMLLFLALSFYYLIQNSLLASSMFFAFAVGSKLIPLLIIPALVGFLGFRKGLMYCFRSVLVILIITSPFIDYELLTHFFSSINLYFQHFEFNASVYYVVRAIGWSFTGYNIIQYAGPTLAFISASAILFISIWKKPVQFKEILSLSIYALTIYFLMATTVHPWYIVSLVFLNALTNDFRFPLVWSALVVLSYHHYLNDLYLDDLRVIAVEYLCLTSAIIIDIRRSLSSNGLPFKRKL